MQKVYVSQVKCRWKNWHGQGFELKRANSKQNYILILLMLLFNVPTWQVWYECLNPYRSCKDIGHPIIRSWNYTISPQFSIHFQDVKPQQIQGARTSAGSPQGATASSSLAWTNQGNLRKKRGVYGMEVPLVYPFIIVSPSLSNKKKNMDWDSWWVFHMMFVGELSFFWVQTLSPAGGETGGWGEALNFSPSLSVAHRIPMWKIKWLVERNRVISFHSLPSTLHMQQVAAGPSKSLPLMAFLGGPSIHVAALPSLLLFFKSSSKHHVVSHGFHWLNTTKEPKPSNNNPTHLHVTSFYLMFISFSMGLGGSYPS